ncbi:MAG: membrane fusion protein (multidrug efflux system), partial [Arcticibacterium sp.]
MRLAVSIILGLAILAGAYFLKGNIADTKKPDRGAAPKITNTVFVQNVTNKDLPIFIETNGTIKAQERIELFSEVQGVLKPTKKAFKPGQH